MMWGFLGDRILVNGKPNAAFSLEPRAYRLRILNGSNARTYKLAWSNNMPLEVIGTDGGLLPAVVSRNYVMLMPGERVDVWADFSSLAGKQVILRSLAFQAGGMGMMGGGMGGMGMMGGMAGIANGAAFDILTVNVGKKATTKPVLGPLPALSVRYDASNVPNYNTPRPFMLSMGHMMTWTINGRVFEMEAVAEDEKVNRDETMAWEWINNSPIPHPMHIHNVQFQVVQRTPPRVTERLQHDQPGSRRQRLEGYGLGLARRTGQDRHEVWTAHGHVHVSLSHPGTRRYDHDAQLDGHGPNDARNVNQE